jgi:hypothetical protein
LKRRHQARVFDHVRHERSRVSTNRVEFEAGFGHEVCEDIVRCDSDSVSVLLQLIPQGQERLNVASASDHLDYDVKLDVEGRDRQFCICDWRMC